MKILFAIVTCPGMEYVHRREAQEKAWAERARVLGWDVQVFDGRRLCLPDDYEALPRKTKAICQYAMSHRYDALVKLDDDTYINLVKFEAPLVEYAGLVQPPNDYGHGNTVNYAPGTCPFPYASGGGYWLESRAFSIVGTSPITDWAEDRWVGNTLGRQDIPVTAHEGFVIGPNPAAMICTQLGARELAKLAPTL